MDSVNTRGGARPGAGRPTGSVNHELTEKQRKAWQDGLGLVADHYAQILTELIALATSKGRCLKCGERVDGFRMDSDAAKFIIDRFSRIIGADPDASKRPIEGIAVLLREIADRKE